MLSHLHLCPDSSQLGACTSGICLRSLLRSLRSPVLPGSGTLHRFPFCFVLPPRARRRRWFEAQLPMRGGHLSRGGQRLRLRLRQLPLQGGRLSYGGLRLRLRQLLRQLHSIRNRCVTSLQYSSGTKLPGRRRWQCECLLVTRTWDLGEVGSETPATTATAALSMMSCKAFPGQRDSSATEVMPHNPALHSISREHLQLSSRCWCRQDSEAVSADHVQHTVCLARLTGWQSHRMALQARRSASWPS